MRDIFLRSDRIDRKVKVHICLRMVVEASLTLALAGMEAIHMTMINDRYAEILMCAITSFFEQRNN